MLTSPQCDRYSLPRTPIRRNNRRRARFEHYHGPGATELDALAALRPGTIGRLLAETLGYYCSSELARQIRAEAQSIVGELSPRLTERLNNWIPVLGTCGELSRPKAKQTVNSWLYDSSRDYTSQLASYRQYLDFDSKAAAIE